MPTARSYVVGALRKLGVLAAGETATADDAVDGLTDLNAMLGSWTLEGLMSIAFQRQTVTLVPGQATYTVGTGGNWNIPRPVRIDQVTFREAGTTRDYPVRLIDTEVYSQLWDKVTFQGWPIVLYYEASVPLATAALYPVPDGADSLTLYSRIPFVEFADLNTDIDFAPGYDSAIVHNLAVRLAPEYGLEAPATILSLAVSSKDLIKRGNVQVPILRMPAGLPGRRSAYNIYRGE